MTAPYDSARYRQTQLRVNSMHNVSRRIESLIGGYDIDSDLSMRVQCLFTLKSVVSEEVHVGIAQTWFEPLERRAALRLLR